MAERVGILEKKQIHEGKENFELMTEKKESKFTLDELLQQCKPGNRPNSIDFGIAGKELI